MPPAEKITPGTIFLIFILVLISVNIFTLVIQGNPGWDSAYWTLCTLTWSNCKVEVLYSTEIKILSIIDGISTIAIILVLLYTFSEHILGIDLESIRVKKRMAGLKNHYIVCGYGRVGKEVCDSLARAKAQFIVIDRDRSIVEKLKAKRIAAICGDVVVDTKLLSQAGAKTAKGFVATLGSDADNMFVTLSAKEINPNLLIAARAHTEAAISRLKKAGAGIVVMPELLGGAELSKELLKEEKA